MLLLSAASAWADAEEASLDLSVGPALLRVESIEDTGEVTLIPGLRASTRFTYGLTDHLAFELGATGVLANGAQFDSTFAGNPARATHDERVLRGTFGLTYRGGVRAIPTVTLLAGYQHRWLTGAGFLNDQGSLIGPLANQSSNDLVVGLGLGIDLRLGRHLIIGLSLQAVYAFSLDGRGYSALELPVSVAHYWYPEWKTYDDADEDITKEPWGL
jgi:hypothetical protein